MRHAVVCAACVLLCGCEDVRELLDPAGIEQQLRDDPGRPGKVGSVVAVSVFQHAARTADRVATAPEPSCELAVEPGHRWVASIRLERLRLNEVVARWEEERSLQRTSTGTEVRSEARYRTMIGQEGARTRNWRRNGSDVWVSTEAADGPLWYHRTAEEAEAERQLDASIGTFQALLDAVDGWQPDGDGAWKAGDTALRCVRSDEGHAFVDRFVVRATLRDAKLRADRATRRLDATWDLEDGTRLRIAYRDQIAPMSGELDAPPENRIVPIERDRSLAHARELADDLASAGLATLSGPEATDVEKPRD